MDRTKFIGGSDIAAICGVSPWKTAYQLYLEKIGDIESNTETELMYWGTALEPVIRNEFIKRTGHRVIDGAIINHQQYPFLQGQPDGLLPDLNAILEIKCVNAFAKSKWEDAGIPIEYLLQVAFYCELAKADKVYFAVLFGGSNYQSFEYEYDKEIGPMLIQRAVDFWECVENRTPPAAVDMEDMKLMYRHSVQNTHIIADSYIIDSVNKIREMRKAMSELSAEDKRIRAEIMQHMKENEILIDSSGSVLATFKQRSDNKRYFVVKGE